MMDRSPFFSNSSSLSTEIIKYSIDYLLLNLNNFLLIYDDDTLAPTIHPRFTISLRFYHDDDDTHTSNKKIILCHPHSWAVHGFF